MGIPNLFNDIIQKHLNVYAAWVPIVNNYRLGDYGIFSDGVFTKLGNVTDDFQVTFTVGSGNPASIDFTSESASIVKIGGSAGVDVAPAGNVKASIEIEFKKEKSFLVKLPTITVTTIENVNELAKKLKDTGNWDGKWKVVHQVYNALDAVVISTIEAGTKINFSGDATALGDMKLGSAGVNIDTNKALGLKINGKNGPIGLGLFRIKSKLFGGWKIDILSLDETKDEDEEDAIILDAASSIENDL
jgi:hypothetical protein